MLNTCIYQHLQIAYLLAQINETAGKADEILAEISLAKLTSMDDFQEYLVEKYDLDPETISLCTQVK